MLGFEYSPGIILIDIIRCIIVVIARNRMEFDDTSTTLTCSLPNLCVCITCFEYDAWAIFMGQSYENRMRSIEFMCLYSLLGLGIFSIYLMVHFLGEIHVRMPHYGLYSDTHYSCSSMCCKEP